MKIKIWILMFFLLLAFPMTVPGAVRDNVIKTNVGPYTIGDIILSDNSIVKAAEFITPDDSNLPVAIIAGLKDNGTIFAVGVHRSAVPLPWAYENTSGYSTKFTDTVCSQTSSSTFAGDLDGQDNWDAVCAMDQEGTTDMTQNYPAFHFVNTYAESYGLAGNWASGWYLPSIAELYTIYENRKEINSSLKMLSGSDHRIAMDGSTTNWYWSSSQASSEDDYAWFVHYFNGYAGECPKNFTNLHVLAVHDLQGR